MKRLFFLFFILSSFFSISSFSQDLTGIWRGYFISDNNEQYRYEIQMEQSKNNALSGVTYSYREKSFYGKTSMTGNFTLTSGNALIQELKTLEVRMKLGSVACIQKCLLTYTKSGREEFLEGTFTSVFEKTDSASGYIKGANCGGGRMYLRKVITSDFYIEPFLRNKSLAKTDVPPAVKAEIPKSPDNKTSVSKSPPNQKTSANVTAKNNSTAANKTGSSINKNNLPSNKNIVITKPKTDSVERTEIPDVKNENIKSIKVKPAINIPAILKQRENDLLQTIIINSEDVTVKLYDNGEIDDDTISVYLDNQLVLSKKRLTASALTINLKMDESNPEHELVMVADNLGRIPPNTSLMVVNAGDKRFEVRITSTEQKNAVVRFKYVKPEKP